MSAQTCHRFLIGLKQAEAQAKRERPLGWKVGVLDPGVDSKDYHWRIAGDDVLCYAVDPISLEYVQALGLILMAEGARIVGIFDHDGNCLFGRFPEVKDEVDG